MNGPEPKKIPIPTARKLAVCVDYVEYLLMISLGLILSTYTYFQNENAERMGRDIFF